MRLAVALAFLFAATPALTPALAQAPQAYCPYGQTCQNRAPVPFPVINPLGGLNNIPNLLLGNNAPAPPPPATGYAPIATPPPVLPPSR
jgi:hypothetical protein